ncbi:MAG: hypothetical protein M1820_009632 [Bogoriella megaspora]|nr:MAG: hypothetical protein M1820_009632 [Bogoriella megaspora]
MSKLAVLYVYHSIFVNKVDLLGCKIVGVFIILSTLAEVPISVFQCTPVHGLWELNVTAKCIDKAAFIRYGPIPNMLTDIALMVLPIRTIRTIQVPLRVKIGIFITFLMGSIGLLVCIARFIVLFQPVSDSSWQGVPVNLCTMAEATTYLMSACLLQIRPLLTFLFRETPLSKLRNWNLTHTASRLNVIETGHQKRSRHASHIGMHSLGKPSSKDSTPLTNKDGITITNEFTVAYERGILDEDHSYERSRSTSTIDPTEQV